MTISAPIWTWIVIIAFAILFIASTWLLSREAKIIYGFMDEIMEQARKATTDQELQALQMELISWSKGKCWHRSHGARAREVFAYIQGRRAAFK